jgi:hypothetical protein
MTPRVLVIACAVSLLTLTLMAPLAGAQPPSLEPRVPAGKCVSTDGTLLTRAAPSKPWATVAREGEVSSRDLLLALPGITAMVEPRPESVRLTLWGNLRQLSSFPGRESAIVLHDSRAFDLDFTLLRGRVVVANRKTKGPAKVWVRLPDDAWEINLAEPGAEVALELFGRWPRGVGFSKTPGPDDGPTHALMLLALKGQAELRTSARKHTLTEPPGTAYFEWDSVVGDSGPPRRIASVPDWYKSGLDVPIETKALLQVVARFRANLKDRAPDAALRELLKGADDVKDRTTAGLTREYALQALTALDDVTPAVDALADAKHAALRAAAVFSLRHWIGEDASHDLTLYNLLVEHGYGKNQAETILQLLHNPFEPDKPETYETLIAYLDHDKLAIRQLAHWHLERMTTLAAKIGFDPAATEKERAKAIAQWKRLIPSGKLPPKDTDK